MILDAQLSQLENAQLIHRLAEEEAAYLFKHSMTQETAYESLLLKKRRQIHRRVAECMERLYADRLDETAALLAKHYLEAGDDAKTLEYAARAGDAAMRIYANEEAVGEFSIALDMALRQGTIGQPAREETLERLFLKRGRALELLSRFGDAAANYDQMEAVSAAGGDRAFQLAALIAQATIRAIPGSARDPEQAQVLSDRALGLARELGDRKAEAKILWNLLLLNIYSGGDADQAVARGEESLAIAREFNLREQMGYTLHDLFVAYAYLGDLDKARSVRVEAANLWRELDNQPMLAESLSGLSVLHFMLGDPEQAKPLAQEALQISHSIGNLGGQGFSGTTLGLIYFDLGEFDNAIKATTEAIPITLAGGLEGNGISPFASLGLFYATLGDYHRARELLRSTFQHESAKLPLQRMWLSAILTRIELLAGDLAAAHSAFLDGPVVASLDNFARMFPAGAPQLYISSFELKLAEGDRAGAIQVADSLIEHLQAIKVRAFVPEALLIKGQALRGEGKTEQAAETWRLACSEAEGMAARRVLWRILLELSRVEAESGRKEEANRFRAEARAVVEYIAERAPDELRASFLALPMVCSLIEP
jgi:tetratricopeptide (TPR) repeat protein